MRSSWSRSVAWSRARRRTQLVDVLAASAIPNAHLLVVGDGPDAPAIRQRAAELGVRNRVHLLGQVVRRGQVRRACRSPTRSSSTSQHEGFGLVFLEAMAFGLPVVCYDRGGQTDFLTSGETGHVVKLNDRDAFTPRGACEFMPIIYLRARAMAATEPAAGRKLFHRQLRGSL